MPKGFLYVLFINNTIRKLKPVSIISITYFGTEFYVSTSNSVGVLIMEVFLQSHYLVDYISRHRTYSSA